MRLINWEGGKMGIKNLQTLGHYSTEFSIVKPCTANGLRIKEKHNFLTWKAMPQAWLHWRYTLFFLCKAMCHA